MEKQVSVSVSMGVVNSLRSKLDLLIQGKPMLKGSEKEAESSKEQQEKLPKLKSSEKKEVESFKGELDHMRAVLVESAMMDAPDVQVTAWMRQVREITYDAEDFVDLFLRQPDGGGHGRKQPRSFFMRRLEEALGRSNGFAEQIQQLKARLVDANERRNRYKVEVASSDEASRTAADLRPHDATIDPDLVLMQLAAPVAIDGPTEQLLKILGDDGEEKQAKVISIVGMAGIGKTTLALHVYQMRKERFGCAAFVYVGRRPSVTAVLVDIISQVNPHKKRDDIVDEHEAMVQLRDTLQNKRYLIVIDDIWSISSWKGISCALPHNVGSRVIVTTRTQDIARACSHRSDLIYEMPPLGLSDSERLFHSRVSGSAEEGCSNKCKEVHDSILTICGGLPSSILIVASFLARTAKPEEWEMIYKSTLSKLEQYPPLERMNKILHLGYTSLPFPAKSCFLYLSVFPKNYQVRRDRLIWRWIAEGFIPGNLFETGISYFNELINRCLIQPVFADDGADDEDPVGCKVQGAVHDFIVSLSSAENFVILLDEELTSSTLRDTVRRLSLNCSNQREPGTKLERRDSGHMNLSQARSLTVLGRAQQMPHLSNFQLLRVLDLEDADGVENKNLEDIGRLFNLVYLGLAGCSVTELPKTIGELQHLETLDVTRTKVKELPEGLTAGLVRLLAKMLDGSKLAVVLEKMQGLQELSMVGVNSDPSLEFIAKLVGLKQLRVLGLNWCFSDNVNVSGSDQRRYISCLNQVSKSNISSLSIQSPGCSLGFLADSELGPWDPPYKLQKLVMTSSSYFDKIPAKLDKCTFLTYLEITVDITVEAHLGIIANLPALTILKLSASGNPVTITQGFRCLKLFSFQRKERGSDLRLVFQAGAMQSLRKLCLNFKVPSSDQLRQLEEQQGRIVSGLEHLPSLMQVNVKMMDCDGDAGVPSPVEEDIKKHMRVDGKSFKLMLSREKARQEEKN